MIKPIDSFENRFSTGFSTNASANVAVHAPASSYVRATQLTAAKPRCGLQSIGELIPRLIRQYEIQAEMNGRVNQQRQSAIRTKRTKSRNSKASTQTNPRSVTHSACEGSQSQAAKKQATFAWYD